MAAEALEFGTATPNESVGRPPSEAKKGRLSPVHDPKGHGCWSSTAKMPTKTFWCDPTGMNQQWLRRYSTEKCSGVHGIHNARVRIEDAQIILDEEGYGLSTEVTPFLADPRWPVKCEGCDYVFQQDDNWQLFTEAIYRPVGTTDEYAIRDLLPGAMIDAFWYPWKGADGLSLQVVLPNKRPWLVDGPASNCGLPDDNEHRCWVRHGDPQSGIITVDKNGKTCSAGAGSILSGDYHGFLRDGELT